MLYVKRPSLAPWQYVACHSPYEHTALYGGVGVGKTYTGSHFAIRNFINHPDLTGFIAANTYDQLTQATLKELFYWLDFYGIPYVYNRQPPKNWQDTALPSYSNILSVRIGTKVAHAFCRVLSDPDAVRGIQFSWYWMDETRDTKQEAHDIVLSRLRESRYRRGLITSTTNGDDWGNQRFCRARMGQLLYGSLHVKTIQAVDAGILTREYYNTLLQTYSELMIAQELNAEHVNVYGGKAYYAASELNRRYRAPWGFKHPDPRYPLIIGCDFNFDPAPHVWMVGQLSPDGQKLHWFKEISGLRLSTEQMAMTLCHQYQGFHFRVFGDRSGARATTSNAGNHDYNQMAIVFQNFGVGYSIDSDTGNNPLVRNRVENMNRLFKDGQGTVRQTYDPEGCPLFDGDCKTVGWKTNVMRGQGKLDSRGDPLRTHATDGGGYAAWKLFPPGNRARIISGVKSFTSQELGPMSRL